MYGIFHIRSVSVGLDSQIWHLFIYITGYLNVRKIYETMDFRTFVGPLAKIIGNMNLRELTHRLHIPWTMPFQLHNLPIVSTTVG